jgi:hypothetical protein
MSDFFTAAFGKEAKKIFADLKSQVIPRPENITDYNNLYESLVMDNINIYLNKIIKLKKQPYLVDNETFKNTFIENLIDLQNEITAFTKYLLVENNISFEEYLEKLNFLNNKTIPITTRNNGKSHSAFMAYVEEYIKRRDSFKWMK